MSWLSDSIRAFFRKGDLLLLTLCLAASGFGMVLIFSATRWLGAGGNKYVLVQFVAICLGIVIYMIMSSVDIELFTERSWKLLFLFNVVFQLLLLTPYGVGKEATGNNSWLAFPFLPVNLQPAEIAKLTFILLLALQCVKLQGQGISRPGAVLQIGGHTAFMCGLIAVTAGDFGMALTYLFIFAVIAWAGGVKKRWFLLALVLAAAAIWLLWPKLKGMYFMDRILTVIDHIRGNPDTLANQTSGTGWQQTRSILAIGSGGLTGQGYRKGIQTQSPYESSLNARYTDEIFAVCGEEFGLIGCTLLLLLLAGIILRCLWVARRAPSPMTALIATGYAGMLLIQVGVNVGMCLYVFPIVGLTLPFISYGGSSIITMFAAMGVVSSVKMRSLPSWLRDRSKI